MRVLALVAVEPRLHAEVRLSAPLVQFVPRLVPGLAVDEYSLKTDGRDVAQTCEKAFKRGFLTNKQKTSEAIITHRNNVFFHAHSPNKYLLHAAIQKKSRWIICTVYW